MRLTKNSRIAISMVLLITIPICISYTFLKAEDVKVYTNVVSDWDGWVLRIDIAVPSILEVGSITTINASIRVLEKGQGELLSLTHFGATFSGITVSTYVGVLVHVGDNVDTSIQIPIVVNKPVNPGSINVSSIQFFLQGYIQLANGYRREVKTYWSIPITLFTPFLPVVAYLDVLKIGGGVNLQIKVNNFDVQPVYKVYTSVYINSSHYRSFYEETIPGGSSVVYTQFISLSPGIYTLLVNVSYVTLSGVLKNFVTASKVVVPVKPEITIEVNTTILRYSQSVLVKGCVKPGARLGVVIEYSFNNFEWTPIQFVESNESGCFQTDWRPNIVSNTVFVRARTIESNLFTESTSNVVTLSIHKLKPVIKVSTNNTKLKIGDYARILITVEPPISIPITIMYREPGKPSWIEYLSTKTNDMGRALIPTQFFTEPGIYVFKVIAHETNITEYAESNEVAIQVNPLIETPTQTITVATTQPIETRLDITRIGVIVAISIVIALVLLLIGRRRSSS